MLACHALGMLFGTIQKQIAQELSVLLAALFESCEDFRFRKEKRFLGRKDKDRGGEP
jgi:hypothetical protein